MTDVSLQPEGKSGSLQAESRAGDEEEDCLYGLYEGAAVQDSQFSARPVKTTIAKRQLFDLSSVIIYRIALHTHLTAKNN